MCCSFDKKKTQQAWINGASQQPGGVQTALKRKALKNYQWSFFTLFLHKSDTIVFSFIHSLAVGPRPAGRTLQEESCWPLCGHLHKLTWAFTESCLPFHTTVKQHIVLSYCFFCLFFVAKSRPLLERLFVRSQNLSLRWFYLGQNDLTLSAVSNHDKGKVQVHQPVTLKMSPAHQKTFSLLYS